MSFDVSRRIGVPSLGSGAGAVLISSHPLAARGPQPKILVKLFL
jgi:hypothetical protein